MKSVGHPPPPDPPLIRHLMPQRCLTSSWDFCSSDSEIPTGLGSGLARFGKRRTRPHPGVSIVSKLTQKNSLFFCLDSVGRLQVSCVKTRICFDFVFPRTLVHVDVCCTAASLFLYEMFTWMTPQILVRPRSPVAQTSKPRWHHGCHSILLKWTVLGRKPRDGPINVSLREK